LINRRWERECEKERKRRIENGCDKEEARKRRRERGGEKEDGKKEVRKKR
jgi:hypothetical protein